MAKLLYVVYSALVILVAVAGLAFVFWVPSGEDGPRWPGLAAAALVLLFLLVMVGDLVL